MPTGNNSDAYQVIWLVRRLFRALGQVSGQNLAQYGISVADRAVMEFLYPDQALSVPGIARRYQVSRQHVQVTVNSLLGAGFVTTRTNPRHKRSPLIQLSDAGRNLFAKIRQNEQAVITDLFAGITAAEVRSTRQTLATLFHQLSQGEKS